MTTCSACFIRKAASSADPRLYGRSMAAASPPLDTAPNPPAITEMKLRFIARHMMYDRIAPELPTSAPVMIIALLCSVTPIAAAAHPERELSLEITTRMAAPPHGM